MKIKAKRLKEIVKEEIVNFLSETSVVDSNEDGDKKLKPASNFSSILSKSKTSAETPPEDKTQTTPLTKDSPDTLVRDKDGDGKIDSVVELITGKQIGNVEFKPKSDFAAGFQEISFDFQNSPHDFKILINKHGKLKFVYKDKIHNSLQ